MFEDGQSGVSKYEEEEGEGAAGGRGDADSRSSLKGLIWARKERRIACAGLEQDLYSSGKKVISKSSTCTYILRIK